MDEQTLEPCPFCGGEARWSPSFIDKRDWGNICCTKCAAGSDYGTRAGTTALWNTRVIAGKVAELEAALIEARVYVEKYGQQNAETGTQLQAMIVALLTKIDAALAPYPERRHD